MKWKYEKSAEENPLKWTITAPNGDVILWQGFDCGPLNLSKSEIASYCETLLGIPLEQLSDVASKVLQPIVAPNTIEKSLMLHSTTSDLGAFEGDFAFLQREMKPKNYAGYVETRAIYLGKTADKAVGRMIPWRNGIEHSSLEAIDVANSDYYYLSDYLLTLAATYSEDSKNILAEIIDYLQKNPKTVIRLYVLDAPIQIFLTWLQRVTRLENIYIDANSPEVSNVWNNKNILYPTVQRAAQMDIKDTDSAEDILKKERLENSLYHVLNLNFDTLPGYVIERKSHTFEAFENQLLQAAQLLQNRYGLEKGCLKASEAGDGGRITPNIDLNDTERLKDLAKEAYKYGDDYVLECHFYYANTIIGNEKVDLTPSTHIRSGQVAPGITLQFKRGNSWMGNLFLDKKLAKKVGISNSNYQTIRGTIRDFLQAFEQRNMGLTIAGIDFAIGHIGGKFGDKKMLAIQDPNISFNGAEFLRVFMEKSKDDVALFRQQMFALTWVFVPTKNCTYEIIEAVFSKNIQKNNHCKTIGLVPNSWGMIGVSSTNFEDCIALWEWLKQEMLPFCQ
ncbi:MAG: hypothetical protein AB8G11_24980 [Saprospiraceae bacterium]